MELNKSVGAANLDRSPSNLARPWDFKAVIVELGQPAGSTWEFFEQVVALQGWGRKIAKVD